MSNINSNAGTAANSSTPDEVTMSSQTIAKPNVVGRQSYRRKQLLNWYRTANPEKLTDFHYTRWVQRVGGIDMKEAIYKATEDELDDLYILREIKARHLACLQWFAVWCLLFCLADISSLR
jgi:hypothetical protein